MRSRLKRRAREWAARFGASSWVTNLVRRGVTLPLKERPTPYRAVQRSLDPLHREAISREVGRMVRLGAIQPTRPRSDAIVSSIFCVSKKGTSKLRPCLDLRPLNRFLEPPRFRLEGLPVVRELIAKGDWTCSIDLSNAYWHVPLSRRVKRWFHFNWLGRTYQFDVLPFGVSIAPWIFWKILLPWTRDLRSKGIRVVVYLDDILIMASTAKECVRHTQLAASSLQALGFCLNQEKSTLVPSQTTKFLGVDIDTRSMSFSLPLDKRRRMARSCRRIANFAQAGTSPSTRELSRLLGQITAASDAIQVHRRRSVALERCRALALKQGKGWDAPCPISASAVAELRWWSRNLRTISGRPIRVQDPDLIIETDASADGWGMVVVHSPAFPHLRDYSASGRLPPELRQAVSNRTELHGIDQAVRLLARMVPVRGLHIQVRTDNTSAMYYVNKGGGRSMALSDQISSLWDTCHRRGVQLSAVHLQGSDNEVADSLSRRRWSSSDWVLRPQVFARLLREFRFDPTIDAFAERHNAKLKRFASAHPVRGSVLTSGLLLDYTRERAYCFPPPTLVGRLLTRLKRSATRALVILPYNPRAWWWPLVRDHCLRYEILRPNALSWTWPGPLYCATLRLMAVVFSSE